MPTAILTVSGTDVKQCTITVIFTSPENLTHMENAVDLVAIHRGGSGPPPLMKERGESRFIQECRGIVSVNSIKAISIIWISCMA